jgi:hypothetical protein
MRSMLPPARAERFSRHVLRFTIAAGGLAWADPLRGAETFDVVDTPGGRLLVSRAPSAMDCPDARQLSRDPILSGGRSSRSTGAGAAKQAGGGSSARHLAGEPILVVTVRLEREGAEFVATFRAEGRRVGVRTLRTAGPTCAGLHDALRVSLAVLFDAEVEDELADTSVATSEPPSSDPQERRLGRGTVVALGDDSRLARAAGTDTRGPFQGELPSTSSNGGAFAVGAAATHGLSNRVSASAYADFMVRSGPWDAAAGAFWMPEQSMSIEPGALLVQQWGGRLKGCGALIHRNGRGRLSLCALGTLAELRASSRGLWVNTALRRALWTFGAGPEAEVPLLARLAVGLQAFALFSPHSEAFEIAGVDTRFETNRFSGWVGADLRLRIW